MKFTALSKLSREDYVDSPSWFGKLLEVLNVFMDQLLIGLRGKLTPTDNMLVQRIEFDFVHGVETAFLNKLGQKPDGIWVTNAQGQMIVGYKLDYNQKNEILITVNFAAGAGTTAKCTVFALGR